MTVWISRLRKAIGDTRGVSAVEYAILAVAIVIVVGAAAISLNEPNKNAFRLAGSVLSDAIANAQNFGSR